MLGILRVIIASVLGEKLPGPLFIIFMLAFPLAFWCRQNWARLIFLIFFLLGLPMMFLIRDQLIQQGTIVIVTLSVQTIMQAASLALLFTPRANSWFRRQDA